MTLRKTIERVFTEAQAVEAAQAAQPLIEDAFAIARVLGKPYKQGDVEGKVFEDDRMEVMTSNWGGEHVIVHLNDRCTVLSSKPGTLFVSCDAYKPGRWVKHLAHLKKRADDKSNRDRQAERLTRMAELSNRFSPVDDAKLFSDYEDKETPNAQNDD